MRRFGFELLVEQSACAVAERASRIARYTEEQKFWGDTPIERLFYSALLFHTMFGEPECVQWELSHGFGPDASRITKHFSNALYCDRQQEIEGVGRVDFLIHAYADWPREPGMGSPGWRHLIVECDGHDFHERTKEQAAKDRSRDRASAMLSIDVFRFTGSELWRDPWGCARQVIAWADRGV